MYFLGQSKFEEQGGQEKAYFVIQSQELQVLPNFECRICNQRFKTESYLQSHSLQIHGRTHYAFCYECNKGFLSANGYKEHIAMVHKTLTRGPQCHICQKFFMHESRLKTHMKSHRLEPQS